MGLSAAVGPGPATAKSAPVGSTVPCPSRGRRPTRTCLCRTRSWPGRWHVVAVTEASGGRELEPGRQPPPRTCRDTPHAAFGKTYGTRRIHRQLRREDGLANVDAAASVGSVADSYDNAMTEALNGTFKAELIEHQAPWRDADRARRRHRAVGGLIQHRAPALRSRPPPARGVRGGSPPLPGRSERSLRHTRSAATGLGPAQRGSRLSVRPMARSPRARLNRSGGQVNGPTPVRRPCPMRLRRRAPPPPLGF